MLIESEDLELMRCPKREKKKDFFTSFQNFLCLSFRVIWQTFICFSFPLLEDCSFNLLTLIACVKQYIEQPFLTRQGNIYTGEGTLLLVQLSINSKVSCWENRKEKSCFFRKLLIWSNKVNKHDTTSLSLTIQNIIAQALDEDNNAIMASIDLTAAFDMVNVDLLLKRMSIIGLLRDLIDLVSIWLKERSFYVTINGENSTLYSQSNCQARSCWLTSTINVPLMYVSYLGIIFL